MGKPDWAAIEADYLATGMKYPSLAKKWNVPLSTLKKRASAGGWGAKIAVVNSRMEPVPDGTDGSNGSETVQADLMTAQDLALEMRTKRYRRMIEATDMIMDHIIDALGVIKPDDTLALATLVRALKDLREMQGLNKTALDIEEQQARIAKLKSEIRTVDEGGDYGVILMPEMQEVQQPDE